MENESNNNVTQQTPSLYDIISNFTKTDTDINYINESTRENLNKQMESVIYSPSEKLISDEYRDYKVYAGKAFSEEDLNRARARNQRWYEQAGRSIGQGLVNEVVLGTLRGIFDIADLINQAITKNYDYTNPISQAIEQAQDRIKDEWAIYQTAPGKPFNFSDNGWWAQNFVSIFSTLGLLIPATGYAKAFSFTAKALNFDRIIFGALKRFTTAKRAAGITHTIGEASYIGIQAIASRIGENYQEARQTYRDNYDRIKEAFNNMTNEEKEDFKIRNGFVGLSDEDIFKQTAGQTARDVFQKDMALLAFDLVQFASINKFIKGTQFGARGLARYNQNLKGLEQIRGVTAKHMEDAGLNSAFKNKMRSLLEHPFNTIQISQITEGVEEGWQGIAQAQASDTLERMLNPNFTERNMTDFLQSGEIWEQAFWGWLGGLAFSGAGHAWNKAETAIKTNKAKKTHSAEEIAKMNIVEEEQIASHIKRCAELTNRLIDNLAAVEAGKNPYKSIRQPNGDVTILDNFEKTEMNDILPEEVQSVRKKLIDDYVNELAINAVNNSTGDLMQEWINNDVFKQAVIDGTKDATVYQELKDGFDSALESYNQNLYLIYYNTKKKEFKDINKFAPRIIAAQMLHLEDRLNELNDEINRDNELLKMEDYNAYFNDAYYQKYLQIKANEQISEIQKDIEIYEDLYKNHIIGKTSRDLKIKEAKKKINNILNKVNQSVGFLTNNALLESAGYDENDDIFDKFIKWMRLPESAIYEDNENLPLTSYVTENSKRLIDRKIQAEILYAYEEADRLKTQEDYDNAMEDIENGIEVDGKLRLQNSIDKLTDYIKNSEHPNDAFNDIMEENDNLSDELKEAAHIVKIGQSNYYKYYKLLSDARDAAVIQKQSQLNPTPSPAPAPTPTPSPSPSPAPTPTPNPATTEDETPTEDEAPIDIEEEQDNPDNVIDDSELLEEDIPDNLPDIDISTTTEGVLMGQIMYVYNKFINPNNTQGKHNAALLKEYFSSDGVKSEEAKQTYKQFIKEINEQIENYIIDKNKRTKYIAHTLFKLNKLGRLKGLEDNVYQTNIAKAVLDLMNSATISNATSNMIITVDIDKFDKVFEEYIKEILHIDNLEENKVYNINVDEFFNYIRSHYGVEFTNTLFQYLKNDIIANNSNKFHFINKINYIQNVDDFFRYFDKIINESKENNNEYQHFDVPTIVKEAIDNYNRIKEANKLAQHGIFVGRFNGITSIFDDTGLSPIDIGVLDNYINASLRARNGMPIYYKLNTDNEGYPVSISVHCPENSKDDLNPSNELGYIACVIASKPHTSYGQQRSKNQNRLYFDITDSNGLYTSPLDELFNAIFNESDNKLYEAIRKAIDNNLTQPNDEAINAIIELYKNNEQFKKSVSRKQGSTNKEFAYDIYRQILSIYSFAERFPLYSELSRADSYELYKSKIFNNYKETYDIQSELISNPDTRLTSQYRNSSDNVVYSVDTPYTASKETIIPISNNGDFTLVYFNEKGEIVTDKDKDSSNNQRNLNTEHNRIYSMGFRMWSHPINPGIIHVIGTNHIDKNSPLYEAVKQELIDILENKRKETFDKRIQRLNNILGRGGLFKGVITGTAKADKYAGNFYISKEEKKDGKLQFLATIDKNNEPVKDADKLADKILNELKHNECEECITGVPHNEYSSNNLYITYNNSNQFTLTIGGHELNYNNYTDYVLTNKAFIVQEQTNNTLSIDNILEGAKYNYFKYSKLGQPVEGNTNNNLDSAVDIIKKANINTPIKTRDVLKAFGLSEEEIGLYFGEKTDAKLVSEDLYYDDSVIYDEKEPDKEVPLAYEQHNVQNEENSKIVITRQGINVISNNTNGENGKADFIRLLIHENIHRHYNGLAKSQQDLIDKKLQDIYKRIDEVINEDLNNSELSNIKKNLVQQIKELFDSLKENGKYDTNEFLAEVLSQKSVIEYLDSKEFNKNNQEENQEENKPKSIWQKIVDIIYRILFGNSLYNPNKNSIFAEIYKTLAVVDNNKTIKRRRSNRTTKANNEAVKENKKKRSKKKKVDDNQTEINFEEQKQDETTDVQQSNETIEENEDESSIGQMKFDDFDFAITKRVLTENELRLNANDDIITHTVNGVGIVPDMNGFIAAFDFSEQLKIAKMIENGDILFVCR